MVCFMLGFLCGALLALPYIDGNHHHQDIKIGVNNEKVCSLR